jgi:hypothetical protein
MHKSFGEIDADTQAVYMVFTLPRVVPAANGDNERADDEWRDDGYHVGISDELVFWAAARDLPALEFRIFALICTATNGGCLRVDVAELAYFVGTTQAAVVRAIACLARKGIIGREWNGDVVDLWPNHIVTQWRTRLLTEDVPRPERFARGKDYIAASLRLEIYKRDNYTCKDCQRPGGALTVDHIKPLSRGGLHVQENMQTLCRSCNSKKGDKLPADITIEGHAAA